MAEYYDAGSDFPADPETLLEPFRQQYGRRLRAVMTMAGPAVFRGGTKTEMAQFRAAIKSDGEMVASEQLILRTVLSPGRVAMSEMINDLPGIISSCIEPILAASGVDPNPKVAK